MQYIRLDMAHIAGHQASAKATVKSNTATTSAGMRLIAGIGRGGRNRAKTGFNSAANERDGAR